MSKRPSELNDFAQATSEMVMATQSVTLLILEAEMQALAQMMPGGDFGPAAVPTDEEVEQGFENMPV